MTEVYKIVAYGREIKLPQGEDIAPAMLPNDFYNLKEAEDFLKRLLPIVVENTTQSGIKTYFKIDKFYTQ